MKGKPLWICRDEEHLQNENARRIEKHLSGKHIVCRELIVQKMKWRYSKYGKRTGEKKE